MRSFIFLLALCGIVISCDAKNLDDSGAEIDIDIEVLTKNYTHEYKFDERKKIIIIKDLPTVIFIHGFTGVSDLAELLKDAYFKYGPNLPPADINLLKINWRDGASYYTYAGSAERVKEVGNNLANFLKELLDDGKISVDKLSFVGHSLGAHCAGFAARKLEEILKKTGARDTKIPVIIGLDPARPGFEIKSPGILTAPIQLDGLNESDAEKVLIVHTNPGGFGYLEDAGTVDVYFRYEDKHPSECSPKHTGAKALKYLFRGDIKKAFLTIKDLIRQLGSKLPERIINYFKVTESKGAYLCDHVFANIYFKDAVTEGGRKTDLFTLFKEYSASIPNAIVNEGKDRCQPDINGEKLSWKKECTNAKRIKSADYKEKV